mgnify:CR=1 FL=1
MRVFSTFMRVIRSFMRGNWTLMRGIFRSMRAIDRFMRISYLKGLPVISATPGRTSNIGYLPKFLRFSIDSI